MKPGATAQAEVATQQVALSEQELRELLTALTKAPTVVVLQVGCVLRLVLAVMMSGLPTGYGTGGSESRVGVAAGSKVSRRAIRAAASSRAPAARRRFSLTSEDKEQAAATIAAAIKEQAKRAEPLGGNGGSAAAKGSDSGEKAKQARQVNRSWAARAKRNVPSLLELLKSGATTIGIEHAILIRSNVEGIPVEKAARVSTTVEFSKQNVDDP